MAKVPLVERDKEDGKILLRQLDQDEFPVSSAFWYYSSEDERWDLIIASRLVREQGPLAAYRELGETMKRIQATDFSMDSSRVHLVDEKDFHPSLLRKAIKTGTGISGISFGMNVINGTLVEDAYIYRST
jgi:hypothetical protein